MAQQQNADIEIDFNTENVKDFSGEGFAPACPPGEYVVDITDFEQKTSGNNNPMVDLTFTIAEGDYTGTTLVGHYVLTQKAAGRIRQVQTACGARHDKIRKAELVGSRILVAVVHNEGKQQNNPDGTPKCDSNGDPYPSRIFANVCNERALEAAPAEVAPVAPPPVARKAAATPATRRA